MLLSDLFKPKMTPKKEILTVDTGEGRGSYGELLEQPKPTTMCISGHYTPPSNDHSGYRMSWATGLFDWPNKS
jgi:hypothetical protein